LFCSSTTAPEKYWDSALSSGIGTACCAGWFIQGHRRKEGRHLLFSCIQLGTYGRRGIEEFFRGKLWSRELSCN